MFFESRSLRSFLSLQLRNWHDQCWLDKNKEKTKKVEFWFLFVSNCTDKVTISFVRTKRSFLLSNGYRVTTLNNFQISVYCGPLIKVVWFRITLWLKYWHDRCWFNKNKEKLKKLNFIACIFVFSCFYRTNTD
jgi:hypothetical protein